MFCISVCTALLPLAEIQAPVTNFSSKLLLISELGQKARKKSKISVTENRMDLHFHGC